MKRTFTTIVCALLLVAVLAGCGSTGSSNPFDAKAKTFDAEGMQITLTTDFSEEDLEGYTVGNLELQQFLHLRYGFAFQYGSYADIQFLKVLE